MEIQLKDNTSMKKSSKMFGVSSFEFGTDAAIAIKVEEVESESLSKGQRRG